MENIFCFHIPQVATFSISSDLPLPTFIGDLARPSYIENMVFAIIADGKLSGDSRPMYLVLTRWIGAVKTEKMQSWAEAYAREIEEEAHELSSLECDYVQ